MKTPAGSRRQAFFLEILFLYFLQTKKEQGVMMKTLIIAIQAFLVPATTATVEREVASVPEPGTILLLGVAVAGLGIILFWRSRKKR